jgi:hypothetical protein
MRKIYTYIAFFVSLSVILIVNTANSSGRPGSYSGSPGDNGLTCTSCHGGGPAQNLANAITTNIPSSGYVPGNTYTLTLTNSHPTNIRFGFQVTAEDASNSKVGTFLAPNTAVQVVNGGNAATHTSSGNMGTNNARTWTVDWVAPPAGTGDVTFYAAFNSGNGSNANNQVRTSNTTVSEDVPAPPLNLVVNITPETCPGACDGTITPTATGGEGPPYNFTITGGSDVDLCPGQYTVTVFDSQNNTTQTTVTIDSGVAVTAPTLSQVWDRVEASSPDAVAYRWFINGNVIPGADSSWVFITQNGVYRAEALSETNCGEADSLLVENFSVSRNAVEDFSIYPNPGRDQLFFTTNINVVRVEIHDISGRKVLDVVPRNNQISIPNNLASGRYVLSFFTEDGSRISRAWERF